MDGDTTHVCSALCAPSTASRIVDLRSLPLENDPDDNDDPCDVPLDGRLMFHPPWTVDE